jgi:hypothetical protein
MGTAPVAPSRLEPAPPEAVHDGLPAVHVTDVETDIETLKTIPKQFAIDNEKSANWLVKRIQQSRAYAQKVKEWAEQELRRAAREEQT